ncbi:MAG TPA: hypothetical protein DCQ16_08890, partial [Spirochaetaceae bacterium]|nr:hypothetical protein [Spirochaetaceae bacterium]
MKGPRPGLLFQRIAVTGLRMLKKERPNGKIIPLPERSRLGEFLNDDFVIDIHIQGTSRLLHELGDLRRPEDVEGFFPIDLAREHEDSRKPRHMVGVHMGNEY